MPALTPFFQKFLFLFGAGVKSSLGLFTLLATTSLLFLLVPNVSFADVPTSLKPSSPLLTTGTGAAPKTLAPNMARVDVVNPNPLNNPKGLTYPGYRASNQLLMYNTGYPYPSTGTNEFGYEVTVVNNRVVEAEGADSAIPTTAEGYVLSGHGKQRNWLIQNAPIGATLNWEPDTQTLTSTLDYNSYRFKVEQSLDRLKALAVPNNKPINSPALEQTMKNANITLQKADALNAQGATIEAQNSLVNLNNQLEQTQWQHLPTFPAQAIKGVWHRPTETTSEDIAATLDKFKAAGLNSVFLETFFHGYPLFPSKTYARYGITPNEYPKFAGRNVLQLWLTLAHQRGMQVHAWVQVFYVGNKALGGVGPVLAKYPQWANWQRSAAVAGQLQPSTLESGHYFVDPANPEVRTFLLSMLDELLNDYAIDGLQLDYIRYPASFPKDRFSYVATTWGYSPYARQTFAAQFGTDPLALDPKKNTDLWQQWNSYKTEQINTFVSTVASHAQQVKQSKNPQLLLSAAVFPGTEGLLTKHQNWPYWKQQGWVDAMAPMSLTGSVRAVSKAAQFMQMQGSSSVKITSGIFSPFNNLPPQRLIEQLQAALKSGGNGYILFDSAHLSEQHQEALGLWQLQNVMLVAPTPSSVKTMSSSTPNLSPLATKDDKKLNAGEKKRKVKKLKYHAKTPRE